MGLLGNLEDPLAETWDNLIYQFPIAMMVAMWIRWKEVKGVSSAWNPLYFITKCEFSQTSILAVSKSKNKRNGDY
jgi:hypothetical protein